MRAVVQRVRHARVLVESGGLQPDPETRVTGEVGPGFCVLLSVGPGDTEATADHLAERVARLRICADPAGRMNLDLHQTGGEVLVVSQFTLHGDASGGHRPSFLGAAPPALARRLYERFGATLADLGVPVAYGEFGALMQVELINDGPVTLVLSTGEDPWKADAG
ncbi:MAG: D-aminoacyl-tRNA deacylase [Candidatus Dormibacteria bacterium]|jgi:D-tyrosyl-tRNA(Tyr) deacylase